MVLEGLLPLVRDWRRAGRQHGVVHADEEMQGEARDALLTLLEGVLAMRAGKQVIAGAHLKQPREK